MCYQDSEADFCTLDFILLSMVYWFFYWVINLIIKLLVELNELRNY